jgi:hypothetical protein
MTSDQNVSDVQMHSDQPPPIAHQGDSGQDAGQNVQHGMGQSKSSRRRRRKRKGKGPEDVALNGAAQSGDGSGDAASAPQANASQGQPARQQNAQASGQQNSGQNATGTKRWKKKFRDRDRPREGRSENPGNQASGSSNGHSHSNNGGGSRNNGETHQFGNNAFKQRKGGGSGGGGKQRGGSRGGFVGPMDHSYRAVNGNFADTPPSTIEAYGNHQPRSNGHSRGGGGYHGDSQPIDYSQGRAIPIPEDAQTKIFFFIDDLFFVAKIQETARKLGVKIEFVKNDKESLAKLTGVEEADRPALIVFDLNNASAKPMTLIPKLKTKFKKSTSIVGFLSHLQGDLKAKAVEAGCDSVMPRAAFSQNLPNLLRRYGIVEEEEANYNM